MRPSPTPFATRTAYLSLGEVSSARWHLAAAERFVDSLGERSGVGREALRIPGEADRGDAVALGERERGQVGHLADGGIPGRHDDARRSRLQRGDRLLSP